MKRKTISQLEITWSDPEPFQLTVQTTEDGDRLAKEQAQVEADRKLNDLKQTQINIHE